MRGWAVLTISHMKHMTLSTMMRPRQKWKVWCILITMTLCSGATYLQYIRRADYMLRSTFHGIKKITPKEDVNKRIYKHTRGECTTGDVASKAAGLIKYSRSHPAFLQLSDFFWRTNHSLYSLPYGTNGSEEIIMKALTVLNQYHLPEEIDRLQCRRCVVVGNGFQMTNSGLGEKIDDHDVVIRLNNAPVHNYQEDVGNKTTLSLFYPESAHFDQMMDNNPDTLSVLVPFKPEDILWINKMEKNETLIEKSFWKQPPVMWELQPQNMRLFNPYYVEFAATEFLGSTRRNKVLRWVPTTGLIAITFAIHFCDQVNIAGFGYPMWNLRTEPIHYYNNKTMENMFSSSQHNIPLERRVLRKLLEQNVIQSLTAMI